MEGLWYKVIVYHSHVTNLHFLIKSYIVLESVFLIITSLASCS